MELSKQVVSLELAKRLKELGVKQDSLWYWQNYFKEEEDREMWNILSKNEIESKGYLYGKFYSAFTVAELGEMMLPRNIKTFRDTDFKKQFWVCELLSKNIEYADTEADARAKVLIGILSNECECGAPPYKIQIFRIRKQYFDAIVSGKKKVEARKISPYWIRRLLSTGNPPNVAKFICGKQVHSRKITRIYKGKAEKILGRPVSEQGREDLELVKNHGWCIAIELGEEVKRGKNEYK